MDLETAVNAVLRQIEEKQYAQELLDRGIQRILYLGLAFEGKKVLIRHKLEFGLNLALESERGKIGRIPNEEPIYAIYWRRGGCDPMKPQPQIESQI